MERPRREIQRRRVHEDIVNYLLEDIKNGVYQIGEELPSERDLMNEFQVGRPAIRESLSKLERMGIINTRPGARAKICNPTVLPLLKEMGNVVELNLQTSEGQKIFQEARCFFESALARMAAKRIDDERLKKLKKVLETEGTLLNDMMAFADTDLEFHEMIAEVSENPVFIAIFHHMGRWLLEQRMTTLSVAGQAARALEAHAQIYEALLAHDSDKVEKAMVDHLQQVQDIYQSIIQKITQ
ncbi:GntR family transcriptional regulator [Synergistales bacterium]|nr:GntR family transcriptional regulator [Synergistales bacterium]